MSLPLPFLGIPSTYKCTSYSCGFGSWISSSLLVRWCWLVHSHHIIGLSTNLKTFRHSQWLLHYYGLLGKYNGAICFLVKKHITGVLRITVEPKVHLQFGVWRGHSDNAVARELCCKPLGCGFKSDSTMCLWDVFLGICLSALCPRLDWHRDHSSILQSNAKRTIHAYVQISAILKPHESWV